MATRQKSKKLCPSHTFFFAPTLKALDELGGSGSNEEIYKKVVSITELSTEILDEMHNFTMTEVEYRLMWARTYLKNFGAIESSRQCVWALTAKGKKMLREGEINPTEIAKYTNSKHGVPTKESEDEIPERLAQRLLRECGFSDVVVTKRSGDGGIDGTGKLRIKGIFSFNVAFQCKKYKGQVGAPMIRDFRGSLGTNIEKGVLITTGTFTRAAKEEASSEGKRLIDLMDGEELIDKLAEYGIGLNEVKSYEVDESFFESLNED